MFRDKQELLTCGHGLAIHMQYEDMCNHKGGSISMDVGALHGMSLKQKVNTKSSTEADLVWVSKYLPYKNWLVSFLKEQCYNIPSNIIFQYNQSAIRMERNIRKSCTGKSRHIHIRYFLLKILIINRNLK